MAALGLRFSVCPSGLPERSRRRDPRAMAADLALQKARAVQRLHPRSLILGADTIVVCRGEILLKPRSRADARRILGKLNGRRHLVHTALALVRGDRTARGVATSRLQARRLAPAALEKLIGKHMDKAGAYAVQDREDPFIASVSGPLDNVIGLPRMEFLRLIRKFDKVIYKKGILAFKRNHLKFQRSFRSRAEV